MRKFIPLIYCSNIKAFGQDLFILPYFVTRKNRKTLRDIISILFDPDTQK